MSLIKRHRAERLIFLKMIRSGPKADGIHLDSGLYLRDRSMVSTIILVDKGTLFAYTNHIKII